ncbi:MAG: hypothetical protein QOG53_2555 [Frankiales bacterium]|jgi:hypothetical protein|nr:hypothetical protein [Frankiales bacterium]
MATPRPDPPKEKLELSPVQIIGSAIAAVAAAIVCSYFGVAGTVIGTAIASIVATTGSALYAHSMRVTQRRLQYLQQTRAGLGRTPQPIVEPAALGPMPADVRSAPGHLPWPAVLVAGLVVFVLSIGIVTTIEAAAGKPISSLLGGSAHTPRKTSLGGVLRSGPKATKTTPTPAPSPSASVSPTAVPSPTSTPSPVVSTVGPTPTATPPPTPTPLLSLVP